MNTLAVIDIGSHSVHLEIFKFRRKKEPQAIYSKSIASHMGRIVGEFGKVTPSLEKHLKSGVQQLIRKAKKKEATNAVIVATAGFRAAKNGADSLRHIEQYIKHPVQLLTPERESELGFAAVQPVLDGKVNQLFVDCGGGSTEVSLIHGKHRRFHRTLPFGSSLLSLKVKHDPPTFDDIVNIMLDSSPQFERLPNGMKPSRALVSGGAIKDLAAFFPDEELKIITLNHMSRAVKMALRKKAKKICKRCGLAKEDVANLIPAAITLCSLLLRYGLDRATYTEKSIRNGIALTHQQKTRL